MGKYGKIFNALFGFWLFFSVVMVISMLVVDPHITQSKQIYKDTSEANSKGVPWPPENKFPDGVPTQPDRLDKATAELEQVFVFPLIVVIVFLAAITGIPLYTVANVPIADYFDRELGGKGGLAKAFTRGDIHLTFISPITWTETRADEKRILTTSENCAS